jgi:hypothetical protein
MEPGSSGMTIAVQKDNVESRSPGNMGHVHAHTRESGSSKDAHKESEVDYVPKENGNFNLMGLDILNKLHSNEHTIVSLILGSVFNGLNVSHFLSCLMCFPRRKEILCHSSLCIALCRGKACLYKPSPDHT